MSSILKTVKHTNLSTVVFSLGAVVIAPILVPVVKPVAKATLKGGIRLYEKSKAALTETGEMLEDLVAEVKAEKMTPAQSVKVNVKTTEE
ncbi:MAG: DUF5132 domain-containing protein [Okeania sp. SIO2F4]|uniref:DUF5132 domain-containing protein n=1 Tax=Okeania sp. SIO2F4 TaxID=2607790 RepID=UPI00142CD4BF|nr:DUF5132 domain-containing protein [Okeania sp. SIO2F4]NES05242.1 DUF5132 domain-containing protein [Okeania sp. SIO2F4]